MLRIFGFVVAVVFLFIAHCLVELVLSNQSLFSVRTNLFANRNQAGLRVVPDCSFVGEKMTAAEHKAEADAAHASLCHLL